MSNKRIGRTPGRTKCILGLLKRAKTISELKDALKNKGIYPDENATETAKYRWVWGEVKHFQTFGLVKTLPNVIKSNHKYTVTNIGQEYLDKL